MAKVQFKAGKNAVTDASLERLPHPRNHALHRSDWKFFLKFVAYLKEKM